MINLLKGKNLSKTSLYILFNQLSVSIAAFALTLVLSNLVSPDVFGTYKLVLSWAVVFALFSLTGMNAALVQGIARGFEGDLKKSIKVQLKWGLIGGLIAGPVVAYWYLNHTGWELALGLLITGVVYPIIGAINSYKTLFLGRHDFRHVFYFGIVVTIVSTAGALLAIVLTQNALAIVISYLAASLVVNLIFYFYTFKYYSPNTYGDPGLISYGKHLSLSNGLTILAQYIDSLLVFNLLGPANLALYTLILAFPEQIRNFLKIVPTVYLPKLSAANDSNGQQQFIWRLMLYSLFILIIILIYVYLSPYIFTLLFPKYLEGINYIWLGALLIFGALIDILDTFLTSKKEVKKIYSFSLGRSILQIILIVILGAKFGIVGFLSARLLTIIISVSIGLVLISRKNMPKAELARDSVISFITKSRMPEERGIAFAVVAMCQAMTEIGRKVELVIPKRKQKQSLEKTDIWKYYQIKKNLFPLRFISALELPANSTFEFLLSHLRHLILSWTFSLASIKFLWNNNRNFVYVFHGCLEVLLLLRLVKPLYKPFVIYESHHLPVGWYDKMMIRLALKRTDLLVTCTQSIADYFIEKGFPKERAAGIHDGTRLDDFEYNLSKRKLRKQLNLPIRAKIVGYGGRFVTSGMEKGISELIKATAILHSKNKQIVLVCVGGPANYVTKYKREAKDLGLSKKTVIIRDGVLVKTLYKYMRAFDICAMPFPWREHFAKYMSPLKMFEYMASKNPILATSLPVVSEVLKNGTNALLVKPDSPEELAKGIEKLIRNPKFSDKISKQAFSDLKNNYTWNKRAEKIIALSAKLYSGQSHPK